MESKLKVLFVAAEMAPLMKVGGLGDVAGELPLKLQSMGLDVCVVIPANKDMKAAASYKGDFAVNMGWRNETCIVREALNVPVPVYLVTSAVPESMVTRMMPSALRFSAWRSMR